MREGLRALSVCLAWLAAACHAAGAAAPVAGGKATEMNDSIVEPEALNFPRGTFGTCINGQTFQIDAVTTFGGWQYATYFDAKKRLCVARRRLPGGEWQRIAFDDYSINHTDVHNVSVIGVCPADGTIHLAFDHHGHPLHYRVSRTGAATSPEKTEWAAGLFGPTTAELAAGKKLQGVTYPAFFATPDGRLQFTYRVGGSGNGDSHLAEYDPAKSGWTMVGEFINGKGDFRGSSTRNAYPNGFDYGPGGRLHATWTWREGLDMGTWGLLNCHDLLYACSDDGGRTWLNSAGQPIGVTGRQPIHVASPGLVVRELPWRWGMMNQVTQTVDARGRVHVVMWQNPPDAPAADKDLNSWRYFHYRRDEEGRWHGQRLPFFGRKPCLVADRDGNLVLVFTKPKTLVYHDFDPGGPLHVYAASAAKGWADWRELYRSEKSFVGEPRVDCSRWRQEQLLSIYAQEAPTAPGQASALHVMDFGF